MNVLYNITEKDRTFIPGSRHLRRGANGEAQIVQPEGSSPAWRGMYDQRQRMVVAVNFNTDFGDGWEFARRALLSSRDDRARLPLRGQLSGIFDDPLSAVAVAAGVGKKLAAIFSLGLLS